MFSTCRRASASASPGAMSIQVDELSQTILKSTPSSEEASEMSESSPSSAAAEVACLTSSTRHEFAASAAVRS